MLKRIHHIGIVVPDLDSALSLWQGALGMRLVKRATIPDQDVEAALLDAGNGEIELLKPLSPAGGVGRFLSRRGGLHHVCFETDNIEGELRAARAKGLALIDERPRRGLAGMICFLHPKATGGVLVEYAEPFRE